MLSAVRRFATAEWGIGSAEGGHVEGVCVLVADSCSEALIVLLAWLEVATC